MAKKQSDNTKRFLDIADDIDRAMDGDRFTDWVFIAVAPTQESPYFFDYRVATSNPGAIDRYVLEALDSLELTHPDYNEDAIAPEPPDEGGGDDE